MKTALSTVIYKQAHPYLQDLLTSVDNQSDKDFDLLIINDNYTKEELEEVETQIQSTVHGINVHIEDISDMKLSIAGTRIEMLKIAKNLGYESLVLVDADDTIAPSRIASYKQAFELDKDKVFFYNKFVTEKGEDVFKTLPNTVENIKDISQANFLGLSNTGIRITSLSEEFLDSLKEGAVAVFDWYLFSRIILDIGKGACVENADTIYRIYEDNTAGTTRDLSKEYAVKDTHYSNLAKRYDYFKYLESKLSEVDKTTLKLSNNHQGYWWSDIQMEDQYEI